MYCSHKNQAFITTDVYKKKKTQILPDRAQRSSLSGTAFTKRKVFEMLVDQLLLNLRPVERSTELILPRLLSKQT